MESIVERNNTSFYAQVINQLKKITLTEKDTLRLHQKITTEYMMKYPKIRGILVYHKMGAGKTILSAAIADGLLSEFPDRKVLFIAPKSLHDGFKNDMKKMFKIRGVEKGDAEYFSKNYKFISLNASNMIQQVFNAVRQRGEDIFSDIIKLILPTNKKEDIKRFKQDLKELNSLGNLDNTTIIIDEAHNWFNSVTNGSQNAIALYYLLLFAKNIKIVFLTGSPIVNDPFEIAVPFNVLGVDESQTPDEILDNLLFGDSYEIFSKYFITNSDSLMVDSTGADRQISVIRNKDKFTNRIAGLVSYFGADSESFKKLLPERLPLEIVRVQMSAEQYSAYIIARDKELEESSRSFQKSARKTPPMQKSSGASSSSYRVMTRQISNFKFPEYAMSVTKDEQGRMKYDKRLEDLKPETFDVKNLEEYSPKILALIRNIAKHMPGGVLDELKKSSQKGEKKKKETEKKKNVGIGTGLVYSQFVESGVEIVAKALERYGMKRLAGDVKSPEKSKSGAFAVMSGDMKPEDRTNILAVFNSAENIRGEILAMLLVTATGAEGINTKHVRHEHVLEPYWHDSRLEQFFNRAIRPESHTDMPPAERTVQLYVYLSDYPKDVKLRETGEKKISETLQQSESTTDVTLYSRAIKNKIMINSFLRAIQEASVDCAIHYSKPDPKAKNPIKCKMCMPNDLQLFDEDLGKDMTIPSPCQPMKEDKVTAKSVTVTNEETGKEKEFMYHIEDDKELHLFEKDEEVGGYVEIYRDHPDYYELSKKIKKKEKIKS